MLKRTPIKPRSKKMDLIYVERRKLVDKLLEDRPWCERCVGLCGGWYSINRSTQIHELLPRGRGGSITDESNCVVLCFNCHRWIHEHPALARKTGS